MTTNKESNAMNSLRNPPFSVGDSVEARLRGKHHWYPATIVRVELEGEEDHQWRFTINYTDGFRDLHYPPPPPPLLEKGVEPRQLRMLREHGALTNLFDECGGAAKSRRDKGWGRRSGWDREAVAKMKKDARPFYEDIEQWDGVSMTNGRLSHLHLQTNNLRGKLPKTIWPCDFLVELNLASNGISGSIPPSVSKLRSLKWLDLSSNALAGRIPRSLGGCAKLQVLDLSHNQLAGPLPSTLGRLLGLKECHLQDNQLNGEVPLTLPEAIRFCEELSLFDVSHNEGLEGVEPFRDAMRRYLPMCATFVGSPQVTDTHSIQSFAVKAERPPTATALKPLSEATWEDEFSPSWELGPLFSHWYTLFLFQDFGTDLFMKRMVRDYVHYDDAVFCAAGRIVAKLDAEAAARSAKTTTKGGSSSKSRGWSSMHVRHGELQYTNVQISPSQLLDATKEWLNVTGELLYVATDEPLLSWFDPLLARHQTRFLHDFKRELEGLPPNLYGMVEQVVLAGGRTFTGTWFSTFSAYVCRLRGYYGLPSDTCFVYAPEQKKLDFQHWKLPSHAFYPREWALAWEGLDFDRHNAPTAPFGEGVAASLSPHRLYYEPFVPDALAYPDAAVKKKKAAQKAEASAS